MGSRILKAYAEMSPEDLVEILSGPSQITRKNASKVLHVRVKEDPEDFVDHIPGIIDALERPEAQTRWECLDCLTILVTFDAKACKAAIDGAEEALFDEKTPLIRENAIRFLCRYGASSPERSRDVWPLIKEALEQFHGEIEYDKILNKINYFALGFLDDDVKKDLRRSVRDIMKNVGGPTAQRLERIIESTKAGRRGALKKISENINKKPEQKKDSKDEKSKKKTTTKKKSSSKSKK